MAEITMDEGTSSVFSAFIDLSRKNWYNKGIKYSF